MSILTKAMLDIIRVEETAGENDAAYRKQMRIILNTPGMQHALARARDAPIQEAAAPLKSTRKRTTKPKPEA